MKKLLGTLILILIMLSIPGSALTTREMIENIHTQENINLVTIGLNNNVLLSSFLSEPVVSLITSNNAYFVSIEDKSYYFEKNIGITTCINNCDSVLRMNVRPKSVLFVYENQDLIKKIIKKGEVDFFTKLELYYKMLL